MKIAAFLACLALAAVASAEPATPTWPESRRAAIALTYDDALESQLDIAIPQLDAAGLKGTFFLMGRGIDGQVSRWRAAAASGHELGNHTVNHPCARGTYPMRDQYTSEAYNVKVMLTEIGVMNAFLQAIDGKTAHAFATPCDQHTVGGQDYLVPLQRAGLASFIRDVRVMPMTTVSYITFRNKSGAEMIAWVENVVRRGGVGVIAFHGVGGDYLSVSAEAHRELLEYLEAHEGEIWTTTFSELMAKLGSGR
jgi:peptidoglycan/xylan/chitin deacetylase (PgdA/CDA1 family)